MRREGADGLPVNSMPNPITGASKRHWCSKSLAAKQKREAAQKAIKEADIQFTIVLDNGVTFTRLRPGIAQGAEFAEEWRHFGRNLRQRRTYL